mgnify:CR=1 FL=1
MNLPDLSRSMVQCKSDLDDAMREYDRAIREDADKDRAAKVAKARAYIAAAGPVAERQALVDLETADAQYEARLAEGMKRSASQAIESHRQWMSALQSLASLTRAEAALARYESRETA